MNRQSKVLVAACSVVVTLTTLAAPVIANPSAPFTNDAVDRVVMSGSPETYALVNELADAYMVSAGCLQSDASFPLTAASPTQLTCQPAAAQTGQLLTENYDHDVVVSYYPHVKAGLRQLCAQSTSRDARIPVVDAVHVTSRPPTEGVLPTDSYRCSVSGGTAAGTVLRYVAVARDAMTFVRWPGGPAVTSLRQYELFDIFVSCALTHWNQTEATYGGEFYPAPSGPAIRVFTATTLSDERAAWDAYIGGDSDNCIPPRFRDGDQLDGERVVAANDVRAVEAAQNDPDAADERLSIYYMSVAAHTTASPALRGGSLLGQIDVSSNDAIQAVAPTPANIASGQFPFTRFAYLAFRNAGPSPVASGAVRRFAGMLSTTNEQAIGWVCKAEGAHSEPIGTPGPGIESAFADRDYGPEPSAAITRAGFVPLAPDANGRRCLFTDIAVN